jgi:Ca2+:H+ antiporter
VARKLLLAALALTPLALLARFAAHLGPTPLFLLAAAALIPLAWLIGEATEHAAEHTGPGVGGFLNASFGNAPELIIALLAVRDGLPDVVRGSLAGSVVSNILLVLGVAMIAGGEGKIDRRSLFLQLAAVFGATLLFLVPAIPGWHGSPERHTLYVATIPVAIVLFLVYLGVATYNLRKHSAAPRAEPSSHAWT